MKVNQEVNPFVSEWISSNRLLEMCIQQYFKNSASRIRYHFATGY